MSQIFNKRDFKWVKKSSWKNLRKLEEDDLVYIDMEKDKLNRQILDIDLILKNCEDY